MDAREQRDAIERARALEKAGRFKSAYNAYLAAGDVQDAARILANAGKPGDAGKLLLGQLKVKPGQVHTLDTRRRKIAYLAATYMAKSDLKDVAVEIFVELGERDRAADILERAGDLIGAQRIRKKGTSAQQSVNPVAARGMAVGGAAVSKLSAERLEREGKPDLAIKAYFQLKMFGEAGRILRSLGRTAEAANMYAEGGMPFEAAQCYLELGDTGKGLDNLIRVPRSDDRYRAAAGSAVRVACDLNILSFQLEHFLTAFVASGPADESEFDTFYLLSRLYEQHNLLENAREALEKIVVINPGYRDTAVRLEKMKEQTKGSAAAYEKIREQEASFRGERRIGTPGPKTIGLPPVPEIPDLPPVPKITGLNVQGDSGPQAAQGVAATMAVVGQDAPPTRAAAPRPSAEQAFVVGNTIAERYLLDSELGRGGMAVVFKARDLELEDDIALKVFLQQVLDPKTQEESLARFKQELKLSRQLNHTNIIRLYDIGLHYGHRYISMELLKGNVMEDLLEEKMDFARGLAYLIQACAGLQAAHDKGVVHRDIKPDNLFVTSEEEVKVMDFGIAKNTYVRGLTMEGMTAGTPEYMAPEQISGFSSVTPAADQYSLGLIAYRMFTGQLAFEHEELTPLLVMHLHEPPRPPSALNPEISPELEKVILKLLAKKPEERFKSCQDLAQHLKRLQSTVRR
ncbi:MAG: serine/threonine protein kinase [Deltaproteobacteria bacterium]|nr:serine/threonine protein kinase [Deltaproteobacteria bacterium]